MSEVESLLSPETPQTTSLLVFPSLFPAYLDQVRASYSLLAAIDAASLSSSVQVVNFHPLFLNSLYSDGGPPDAYDYVNRSPHPTVHLIRSRDLEEAARAFKGDAEAIPGRNMARLRGLGAERVEREWREALKCPANLPRGG
jgi:hypothetical protein